MAPHYDLIRAAGSRQYDGHKTSRGFSATAELLVSLSPADFS